MKDFKYIFTISVLACTLLCACTARSGDDAAAVETTNISAVSVTPAIKIETTASPIPTAELISQNTPAPFSPDVPEGEVIDDEFFADTAFLGNSLVDGFRMYSGLTTPDYYAVTSLTVINAASQIAAMPADTYNKVYILLGINEIGYDVEYFIELYSEMLDSVEKNQPNADVYIMAITPVSEHKDETSDTFNMTRVKAYNKALHDLAFEHECYFLDICTALGDENGFLPPASTTDGVHFTPDHYTIWYDYIKTHYIVKED